MCRSDVTANLYLNLLIKPGDYGLEFDFKTVIMAAGDISGSSSNLILLDQVFEASAEVFHVAISVPFRSYNQIVAVKLSASSKLNH